VCRGKGKPQAGRRVNMDGSMQQPFRQPVLLMIRRTLSRKWLSSLTMLRFRFLGALRREGGRAAQGAAAITCVMCGYLALWLCSVRSPRPPLTRTPSPGAPGQRALLVCHCKDVHASCQSPAALHRPTPRTPQDGRARNAGFSLTAER
jgi:hypothetical protein